MLINKIYDNLENYEIGCDLYDQEVISVIMNLLTEADVSFEYDCNNWQDMEGFTAAFAISYHGMAKLVMFDCKYDW